MVVLVVGIALYLVPSLVAGMRNVPHEGSIVVVNIFLGWTLVGWVVALAMACRSVPALPPGRPLPPCYRCGAPAALHPGGVCPAPEISRSPQSRPPGS